MRGIKRGLAAFSLLTVVAVLSSFLGSYVYIYQHALDDEARPADAVMVLGTKIETAEAELNQCLVARVERGVELYQSGIVGKLLLTGGRDRVGGLSQAEMMRRVAVGMGVREEDIVLETESADTWENVYNSVPIIENQGWKSMILVSDPYHLPRAKIVAQSLGVTTWVSPAEKSPCWQEGRPWIKYMIRDAAALTRDNIWRLVSRYKRMFVR